MNFKDYAGNFIPTNPLATSVTVSADTVAPNVVSAVVKGDSVLEVTFDKAMNIATLTTGYNASNAADLSAQNVKLLDGNLGTTAGHLSAPTAVDSTNKVFDFSIAGTTWNGTTNVESAIVALNNTIADLSGNTITAVTKNVSFNKDVAAPGLVSAVYKNVATYGTTVSGTPITTTYGCIVFTYNTDITAGVAPSTVINDQGTQVSGILGTPVVNNSDATQLVVPLTAAVASGTTSYMILLPTGMVTDDAQTPNSSVAVNQVVSVSAGAVVVGDTTAPSVASAGSNGTAAITTPAASATAAQSLTQNAVIDVNYTEAGSGLDLTTVVNTNNYRLDGLPLPAGSYVTVTGANTTTITLPLGSLTTDKTTAGSGYILTISGIKDKSGNAMATSVENVTLKADANPVLNSAVVNSDGSLSAGFSLGLVDATTVTTGSDFVLTVNGSPLTFAASVAAVAGTAGAPTQYTITNGTGSESGKYVLTVYDAAGHVYNLNNASTITFATAASQAGGAGHAISAASLGATLKASTSITVK